MGRTYFLFRQSADLSKAKWLIFALAVVLIFVGLWEGVPLSREIPLIVLLAVAGGTNAFSQWAYSAYRRLEHPSPRTTRWLLGWTYAQTFLDILLLVIAIGYTGGIQSGGMGMLLVYLSAVGLTYGARKATFLWSSLTCILLDAVVLTHVLGVHGRLVLPSPQPSSPMEAYLTLALVNALLFAASLMTADQARQLRRWWEQAETRHAFAANLNTLSHHSLRHSELEPLLQALVGDLRALLQADQATIVLWEEEEGHLTPFAAYGVDGHSTLHGTFTPPEKAALRHQCRRVVEMVRGLEGPRWLPLSAFPERIRQHFGALETFLVLPLRFTDADRIQGAIFLGYHKAPGWGEQESSQIHRALDIAVPLLSRAVTLHRARTHLDLLQQLANDVTGFTQSLQPEALVLQVLGSAQRLFRADGALFVPSPKAPMSRAFLPSHLALDLPAALSAPLAEIFTRTAPLAVRGETFLQVPICSAAEALLVPSVAAQCHETGYHSLAAWLMPSPVAPAGILVLVWKRQQVLSPQEIAVGRLFAARAGAALYNTYLYQRLHQEARTDALTDLPNRRALEETLEGELKRARRYGRPFSVAMIDLNTFKQINDRFGHQAGDQVLQGVATFLRQRLRETDFVGRYGGDEFLVVLPETDKQAALDLLASLSSGLTRLAFKALPPDFSLSIAYGVATFPEDGHDVAALVAHADGKLYERKPAS